MSDTESKEVWLKTGSGYRSKNAYSPSSSGSSAVPSSGSARQHVSPHCPSFCSNNGHQAHPAPLLLHPSPNRSTNHLLLKPSSQPTPLHPSHPHPTHPHPALSTDPPPLKILAKAKNELQNLRHVLLAPADMLLSTLPPIYPITQQESDIQ